MWLPWVTRAIADNPGVKAANAAVTVAGYELDRSHAAALPTVDMVATLRGNILPAILRTTNFGTNVKDRQVSVSVTVPLLEGGALHAHCCRKHGPASQSTSGISPPRSGKPHERSTIYAAVLSGISQVHALVNAVAAGHSALKAIGIGYGLGLRINAMCSISEQATL